MVHKHILFSLALPALELNKQIKKGPQGFFSVHFMAEIRLYSQWQIISFFPNFCPKIPNSKDQEISCQTEVFRGIKQENMLY